jgi:hypothetical protein
MRDSNRPKGLTVTSIFMSITNSMGWVIINWFKPNDRVTFVISTILLVIGYLVIWFYWKGRNWARILVLLMSLLVLYNLLYWRLRGIAEQVVLGAEAALAIFLLYWLNTRSVREFFITTKSYLTLPAQLVDATLSNRLVQQHFPERTDLSDCTPSEPSQGSVPFDSTLVSDFSL